MLTLIEITTTFMTIWSPKRNVGRSAWHPLSISITSKPLIKSLHQQCTPKPDTQWAIGHSYQKSIVSLCIISLKNSVIGLKQTLFFSNSFSIAHAVLYPIASSNLRDRARSSFLRWDVWRSALVFLKGVRSATRYVLSTPCSFCLLFSLLGLSKSSMNFFTFVPILTPTLFFLIKLLFPLGLRCSCWQLPCNDLWWLPMQP